MLSKPLEKESAGAPGEEAPARYPAVGPVEDSAVGVHCVPRLSRRRAASIGGSRFTRAGRTIGIHGVPRGSYESLEPATQETHEVMDEAVAGDGSWFCRTGYCFSRSRRWKGDESETDRRDQPSRDSAPDIPLHGSSSFTGWSLRSRHGSARPPAVLILPSAGAAHGRDRAAGREGWVRRGLIRFEDLELRWRRLTTDGGCDRRS
jgi:hypothetical protein